MSLAAQARALAGGAIGYISRLIQSATHPFVIFQKIRSAYSGMSSTETSEVYWKGVGAFSEAQQLSRNAPDVPVILSDIQVNPYSIPSSQLPNRFRVQIVGSFQRQGSTEIDYRTVNTYWLNNPTRNDLNQAWLSYFFSTVIGAQTTLPAAGGGLPTNLGVSEIVFIERSF
jgi:hypothetical protein